MSYALDHAAALAALQESGAPIAFTLDTPGAEQGDGSFSGVVTSSVSGYATDAYDGGDPAEYARLGLSESEAPRLFFIATTYGQVPEVGATGLWGNVLHTVKSVKPYRPDGVALFSHVIVSR